MIIASLRAALVDSDKPKTQRGGAAAVNFNAAAWVPTAPCTHAAAGLAACLGGGQLPTQPGGDVMSFKKADRGNRGRPLWPTAESSVRVGSAEQS